MEIFMKIEKLFILIVDDMKVSLVITNKVDFGTQRKRDSLTRGFGNFIFGNL